MTDSAETPTGSASWAAHHASPRQPSPALASPRQPSPAHASPRLQPPTFTRTRPRPHSPVNLLHNQGGGRRRRDNDIDQQWGHGQAEGGRHPRPGPPREGRCGAKARRWLLHQRRQHRAEPGVCLLSSTNVGTIFVPSSRTSQARAPARSPALARSAGAQRLHDQPRLNPAHLYSTRLICVQPRSCRRRAKEAPTAPSEAARLGLPTTPPCRSWWRHEGEAPLLSWTWPRNELHSTLGPPGFIGVLALSGYARTRNIPVPSWIWGARSLAGCARPRVCYIASCGPVRGSKPWSSKPHLSLVKCKSNELHRRPAYAPQVFEKKTGLRSELGFEQEG